MKACLAGTDNRLMRMQRRADIAGLLTPKRLTDTHEKPHAHPSTRACMQYASARMRTFTQRETNAEKKTDKERGMDGWYSKKEGRQEARKEGGKKEGGKKEFIR